MKGVWSEHFTGAAAEKPTAPYERCLICPICNARICRRQQSNTPTNPGRYFFSCPDPKDNKFFKWEDKVKPHEWIHVPYCGGCSAGLCRVKRETTGPNAGRIMFMCRVKEGEGSCGYRVWQDELEMIEARQEEVTMNLFQSGMVNCNKAGSEVTDTVKESKQRDEGTDHASSPLIEPSDDLDCVHAAEAVEAMINNQKHLKGLQEEISSTMDRLFQIEAEVSCCEVEMRHLELQLEKVSKNKEVWEGKYLIASKELEESLKLLEQKEAQQNAAKAAFDRARALLRG